MAYKAGSKIICEIIRSKFYPRVLPKNIKCDCRFHHALAVQGKTRQFNKLYSEGILPLPSTVWRGFMQSFVTNIITLKFLDPGRYVFGCFSKYSTGSLLPVTIEPERRPDDAIQQNEQNIEQVVESHGPGRLSEFLAAGDSESPQDNPFKQKRNLNEIAFKQKQHLSPSTPLHPSRLKTPSKFNWKVPTTNNSSRTKHQFIHRKNVQSEIDFTDNLSMLGDIKERLQSNRTEDSGKLRTPVASKSMHNLHQGKDSLKKFPFGGLAAFGSHVQEFRKLENTKVNVNKERTMELFRRRGKASSGDVSTDSQNKSSVRSSTATKTEKLAAHRGHIVRSSNIGKIKNAIKDRKAYFGAGVKSPNNEYVNPESISSSYSSITSSKFQALTPRFRLKRDLVSVETNTRRVPIIHRRAPNNVSNNADDIEFMPLLKSSPPITNKQKQHQPEPQVKTWNFSPKRTRQPSSTLSTRQYSYKIGLNPSGTGLRQTIVMKTPKFNLTKHEDSLQPRVLQQSKMHPAST